MTQLRSLIAALVLMVALVGCSAANAPESDESSTPTVGIVNIASILDSVVDGLELGMGEFDYTEGENVTYIYNGAVSRDDLEAEIQSLIDQEVDVIVFIDDPRHSDHKRNDCGKPNSSGVRPSLTIRSAQGLCRT